MLPGKPLLHISPDGGGYSRFLLHTPTETWSLDNQGRRECLSTQASVRTSVRGKFELLEDGSVYLINSPLRLPQGQAVASLHDHGPGGVFGVALLHTDGRLRVSPPGEEYVWDHIFAVPTVLAVHCKGPVIALNPDRQRFTVRAAADGATVLDVPFACTADSSLVALGSSDFVLVAVPGDRLVVVNWTSGVEVASMSCADLDNVPPRYVVGVNDIVFIVTHFWTTASVFSQNVLVEHFLGVL